MTGAARVNAAQATTVRQQLALALPADPVPFVGRRGELARLREEIGRPGLGAGAGRARVLVVAGRPGPGSWRPVTAVYDSGGGLVREVTLPHDIANTFKEGGTGKPKATGNTKAQASPTPASKPQQYFEVAITTGGVVSGPDQHDPRRRAGIPVRRSGARLGAIGLAALSLAILAPAVAGDGGTSAALPRFMSLRSDRVNLRVGPGRTYPILWVLTRKGMPVEILRNYEDWRMIRDPDGDKGWVQRSMVAQERTVVVTGATRALHATPEAASVSSRLPTRITTVASIVALPSKKSSITRRRTISNGGA